MKKKRINLATLAHTLSGKERARLILKDVHEKAFTNKKGFLTDKERDGLLLMPNDETWNEYEKWRKTYDSVKELISVMTEIYLRFIYYYEILRRTHLYLCLAPVMDCLSCIIEDEVKNPEKKKQAKETIDLLQVFKTVNGNKVFKDDKNLSKDKALSVFDQACSFVTMQNILDRISEELGFNVIEGRSHEECLLRYAKDIDYSIESHNKIVRENTKGLNNISPLLIDDPAINPQIHASWTGIVFGENTKESEASRGNIKNE